ncbi:hypothetical protein IB286_13970 [Spongiibacter sp. KMU-158]|uniref:Uncharacterized protein n=1 Tax=Spongiibacter pelagi TaxID=2760804 RepID=A0A927C5G2_9GAMM|nr:hypothetical protein [Spongiibacter pelagi]MBD2860106.1 hypothetical protein [Spongiibacter pelagi]
MVFENFQRLLLLICAFIFSFDVEVFSEIRLVDPLFILFLVISIKHWVKASFILVLVSVYLLALSFLHSVVSHDVGSLYRAGHFFKYLLIFIAFFFLYESRLRFKIALFEIKYAFLVAVLWIPLYHFLRIEGYIHGGYRPVSPFSTDYFASDAHLLACNLSIILFYFKAIYNGSDISRSVFVWLTIFAIFLTGSRTGIIGIFLVFMLNGNAKSILLGLCAIFVSLVFFLQLSDFVSSANLDESLIRVVDRFSKIDFSTDGSALGRIDKLNIALGEIQHYFYIIGVGVMGAGMTFYDGLVSILLVHGGFVWLVFVFGALLFFYVSLKEKEARNLLVIYISLNMITEYIFVNRSLIVFVIVMFYAIRGQKEGDDCNACR